jgi:circadian clock protein KaiC
VRDTYELRRQSTGVAGIDAMLNGGLLADTTNALFGPTGCGKTTFGLQYLSLSSAAEPGLFFGFFESPDRLRIRAGTLGIDLAALEARGDLEIFWRPQGEHILDELAHEIISAVRQRGVKRLFIDGYAGLQEAATDTERMTRFVSALANELRALNTTTVMSIESRNILGPSMELPRLGLSSLLEGLMLMRYTEIDGQVRRIVSVTKIRDSAFDPLLHEYKITERGIEVGGTFTGVEAILSGFAREPKVATGDAPRPGRPEER